MSKKFEYQIKKSLEDYEMPYETAAWAALSSKLDTKTPPTNRPGKNWLIGGSAALVATLLIIGALWLYSNKGDSSPNQNTIAGTEEQSVTKAEINKKSEQTTSVQSTNSPKSEYTTSQDNSTTSQFENTYENQSAERENAMPATNANKENLESSDATGYQGMKKNQQSNAQIKISEGVIPSIEPEFLNPTVIAKCKNMCSGESQAIDNQNNQSIFVLQPNGDKIEIPARKNVIVKAQVEGIHQIGTVVNGQFVSSESFHVFATPKIEMNIKDEELYEEGLPVTKLSTQTQGTGISWKIGKNRAELNGREVNANFYHRGTHEITLLVTDENGCCGKESRTIQINKDYNLLAVTAFDPTSSDNRKNAFIPFALTQRSVDFNMIIIDPNDGAVIFETDDATFPWKGTDKRNGQLVEANKAYIWRVILKNPAEGENEEYKGTIVRM